MVIILTGPAEGEIECFTHELRGVIPRSFEYLFSLIKREQEKVATNCIIFMNVTLIYQAEPKKAA